MSLELMQRQKEALFHRKPPALSLEPLTKYERAGSLSKRGEELIAQGKMGCLILAGGQGSRLKSGGPKGFTPVTLIKKKSLFQLLFEKAKAASERAGRPLHIAVMTSPLNHEETTQFLEEHRFFGVSPAVVSVFSQGMLPLLDDRGNQLADAHGKLIEAPNGNGEALHRFFETGIWGKWKKAGVEVVNVVLIDNPLADPFDAELLELHQRQKNEITLKAVLRKNAHESVGVLALDHKRLKVIEYSELPEEQKGAKNPDGTLRFALANISLMCFSMGFIKKIAHSKLPLHLARKTTTVLMGSCQETLPVWKCETFIFDLLDFAKKAGVLVCARENCFSPLKNQSGEASLETVRHALLAFDQKTYEALSGLPAPDREFELDPAFYYPTEQLRAAWSGKPLPTTAYITPI
jgi:UDP-N-acetylglucosamine/UDP-N-acetylgalactosamine diphosphorylase